ncbi:MAG: TasA family protein, partial [Dehalococcoidales bacterium]|nr:TasA family protein [Dehalococcoidales bacterium]
MKKILILTIAALIIMATVGWGTWSYFADSEFAPDNSVYMGTLDLSLNGGNADVAILTGLSNAAPNTSGAS